MGCNTHAVQGILRYIVNRKPTNFNSSILSRLTVVSSTSEGRAHFQWHVHPSLANKDYLHSGLFSGIIDLSTCVTVMGMKNGPVPVSINMDVRYLGNIRTGDTVDIYTEVKKLGKSLSVLEAALRHNVTGDLIATGKHTVAKAHGEQIFFENGLRLSEYVESLTSTTGLSNGNRS